MTLASKQRILITGAYGLIGNLVVARLSAQPERYDVYGMVRRRQPSLRVQNLPFCQIPDDHLRLADLTDFEAVQQAVQGIDSVIHLAADPDGNAGWDSILNNNITGTYHVFEASRLAGVRRILFASTNQVVFGYAQDEPFQRLFRDPSAQPDPAQFQPVLPTQPTRPPNFYACSKVYGEALAYMYAQRYELSVLCLRIGWVTADDQAPAPAARLLWCSQRDCVQFIERSLNAPLSLRYDVFFVQSANTCNLVDIQHGIDVLGYAPQDGIKASG